MAICYFKLYQKGGFWLNPQKFLLPCNIFMSSIVVSQADSIEYHIHKEDFVLNKVTNAVQNSMHWKFTKHMGISNTRKHFTVKAFETSLSPKFSNITLLGNTNFMKHLSVSLSTVSQKYKNVIYNTSRNWSLLKKKKKKSFFWVITGHSP